MKRASTFISISAVFVFIGCTWVNENKAGRSIDITVIDQVKNCKKVGSIKASVKHKVGFVPRNNDKITRELQVLAKNEAVKIGANAIVANHAPTNGKQSYQAFACP